MVGRESWGAHFAIFVARAGGQVRQAILKADSPAAAQDELEEMESDELLALLGRSEPKEMS